MYYHRLEKGQGDDMEGAIDNQAHDFCLFKGWSYPIFCMYSVFQHDFSSKLHNFVVSRKAISDFKCENGYAVVIPYKTFIDVLDKKADEGYHLRYGLVAYQSTPPNHILRNIVNSDGESLFTKRMDFSHQNEFRILEQKSLFSVPQELKSHESYTFQLNHSFIHEATIVPVQKLFSGENEFHIIAI